MQTNLKDCMIIRGNDKHTESVFRPSTRAPSMHWAYMLVDQYSHLLNISIKWIDYEPMVTLTRSAKDECEEAFKHIMEFAKLHNLDYSWCERECVQCDGHPDCLAPVTRIHMEN